MFQFINNITREDIWRDGLILNDGTYTFASNLAGFYFQWEYLTGNDNTNICKDNCKQTFGSSDEIKQNNNIDYNNVVSLQKVTEKDSDCLRNLRPKNVKKPIKVNLNTKSISNKFDQPKLFLQGKIDILIVTETILYSTFSTSQFMIDGHSEPYCFHWNRNGGGVLIHIREDKLSNLLADRKLLYDIEEIFELN